MIFCYGEGQDFPESAFLHDATGRLQLPPIHDVDPPHYSSGHRTIERPAPGILNVASDRTLVKILSRALADSEEGDAAEDAHMLATTELLRRVRALPDEHVRELVSHADALLGSPGLGDGGAGR